MPISAEKLANIRSFHEELNSPRKDGSTSNAPLLLAIQVTTRCNFRCVQCSNTFDKRLPADMSLEMFQNIIPILQTASELYLFGDGEVLLEIPRHLAMISRIYQNDPTCALGFSTNGKLLTPDVYELYSTAGIQWIQLSVDAATKELYEEMRLGGSFDELHANLEGIVALQRRSKARQPQLHLATVISKQNFRQLPMLAEFAKRYGFSKWYINAEYPHNPGRELLRLTTQDLTELECIMADIIRNYSSYYSVVVDDCIGLRSCTNDQRAESRPTVFCTVPWQRFELLANGDVKVCPYYHRPICSMKGKSPLEIWNGKEFRQVRKAFASGTGLPSYCVNCKLGMRRQYLPGLCGDYASQHVGLLARINRRVHAIRTCISG